MAGTADPQHIIDLRAYFCRVLIRAVYSLHGQLRAIAVEDPEILTEMRLPWGTVGAAAYPQPFEEATVARLAAQVRLERFLAQRERLRMTVSGRSSDPGRYRDTILAVAEHLLREAMTGGLVSQADSNESLRAAYPDWFGPPGCAANTCHKRFSRARTDVQELLKAVIRRDELLP